MKQSRRVRQMQRHHKRNKKGSALNLVSLMDIFTILVFFLMVNQSEVEILQTSQSVVLPDSSAQQQPKNTLTITVDETSVVVGGRSVAKVADVLASNNELIEGLKTELEYQAARSPYADQQAAEKGRAITILGDKDIPYKLLKRIMVTCAKTEYTNVSLAVEKLAAAEGGKG